MPRRRSMPTPRASPAPGQAARCSTMCWRSCSPASTVQGGSGVDKTAYALQVAAHLRRPGPVRLLRDAPGGAAPAGHGPGDRDLPGPASSPASWRRTTRCGRPSRRSRRRPGWLWWTPPRATSPQLLKDFARHPGAPRREAHPGGGGQRALLGRGLDRWPQSEYDTLNAHLEELRRIAGGRTARSWGSPSATAPRWPPAG